MVPNQHLIKTMNSTFQLYSQREFLLA